METGQILSPYNAIVTAIADTLYEMSGRALTRLTADAAAGAVTLNVEHAHIDIDDGPTFPETNGRIAVGGMVLRYTGTTATTFTGVTDDDGNAGIPEAIRARTPVMDISQSQSQLDGLRMSFLLEFAEGNELDILARNYGLMRVRGLSDTQLRNYLQAAIYLEAQTIYGIEQVLDAIVGNGNYEVWEDLENYHHTVFVDLQPVGGGPEGRSYFSGLEGPVARTTPTTVGAQGVPLVVYGVWSSTDPARTGTNYAHSSLVISTAAVTPTRIISAGLFVAGDLGKPVILATGEAFLVDSFISTSAVTLATRTKTNGECDEDEPTNFFAPYGTFPAWCEGHTLVITTGDNAGSYDITTRVSSSELIVSGGAFVNETDVSWKIIPSFGNGASTALFLRATAVGNTITTPVNMPANVYLDYTFTNAPSMELMEEAFDDGNDQWPFYVWDEGYLVQSILDLITAAGVRVIVRTAT